MKQRIIFFAIALFCLFSAADAKASSKRPIIMLNPDVTTHIIMPEQLKLVDISTGVVVGDQCADNMVRIKPVLTDSVGCVNLSSPFLGTITLIGERYMTQYDLMLNENPSECQSLIKVGYDVCQNYSNPNVSMPEGEMASYAWAISNTTRKFNNVRANKHGIAAAVYNIYSIDDYFFIDLGLKNNTNIPYDISQMRITLSDKKETKATNSQTLELTPAYVLNTSNRFNKDFRQVIVLEKLTFPEEKVLNIEFSENQISGRVLTIPIEYEDILHADAFDKTKANAYDCVATENITLKKEIKRLNKEVRNRQAKLDKANKEINTLNNKIKKSACKYVVIEKKMQALQKFNREMKKLDENLADSESDSESDILPDDINLSVIP